MTDRIDRARHGMDAETICRIIGLFATSSFEDDISAANEIVDYDEANMVRRTEALQFSKLIIQSLKCSQNYLMRSAEPLYFCLCMITAGHFRLDIDYEFILKVIRESDDAETLEGCVYVLGHSCRLRYLPIISPLEEHHSEAVSSAAIDASACIRWAEPVELKQTMIR